jgi:hypothetical protein
MANDSFSERLERKLELLNIEQELRDCKARIKAIREIDTYDNKGVKTYKGTFKSGTYHSENMETVVHRILTHEEPSQGGAEYFYGQGTQNGD